MKVRVHRDKHSRVEHINVISVVPPSDKFPYWMIKQPGIGEGEEKATFYNMYNVDVFVIEGKEEGIEDGSRNY